IVLGIGAAEVDSSLVTAIVGREYGSIVVVVQPKLSHQIGFGNCFVAVCRTVQPIIFKSFTQSVLVIKSFATGQEQADIGRPVGIEMVVEECLVILLLVVICLVVVIIAIRHFAQRIGFSYCLV